MSVLSDVDIRREVTQGRLEILPFYDYRIQPASYDIALGNVFRLFTTQNALVVNPLRDHSDLTRLLEVESDSELVLKPHELILGVTSEFVSIPSHLCCRCEGKSSLGRIGLQIHSTAGWIDPGFQGNITLELTNQSPFDIILTPGMPIGQLAFMQMQTPALVPYGHSNRNSKYQGDREPAPSKMHKDFISVVEPKGNRG